MADLDLTAAPLSLAVSLTKGSDFSRVIEPLEATFPAGAELHLIFTTSTGLVDWPATVTAAEARWDKDRVEVDALHAMGPEEARLVYKAGDSDLVWAIGPVILYG